MSAIDKAPLLGTVAVNRLGIRGDERADMSVHGGLDKAVYLYPHEHYAFWVAARERLLHQQESLPFGFMGGFFGFDAMLSLDIETRTEMGAGRGLLHPLPAS
jgi:MOSC domain-containing protein YiiM